MSSSTTDTSQRISWPVAVTMQLKKAQHASSLTARSRIHSSIPASARKRKVMAASDRARPVRKPANSRWYSARRSASAVRHYRKVWS